MPPRGVTSTKRKRQYEHVKDSELERGVGEDRAEEIAARTVNKQRAQAGETKGARGGRKTAGGKRAGAKKASGAAKSNSRKTAPARGRKSATRKR